MATTNFESLSDIAQMRLKLASTLTIEREDESDLIIVDVASSRRLRITRPVYELMCKFREPGVVEQVTGKPINKPVSDTIQKLIAYGFLRDTERAAATSPDSERMMARVSPTMFRTPHYQPRGEPSDVAIFGIPYDSGNVVAPGARGGPDSIRTVSCNQEYRCDFATGKPLGWLDLDTMQRILSGVTISDWGNVRFMYGQSPDQIFDRIESVLNQILDLGSLPVCLGGDHSVTYPIVKAIQQNQPLNIIWFDAHTDCGWLPDGQCNHHGNVVTRILELPNVSHVINVGYRGFAVSGLSLLQTSKMTFITPNRLRREGIEPALKKLLDLPCYVSMDIDVLDPAFAPATSTPVPDGLTPEELKGALADVGKNCRIIGFDMVEVNPLNDLGMITAMRACQLITICLQAAFERQPAAQITLKQAR